MLRPHRCRNGSTDCHLGCLLTIYDMAKAVDRGMRIENIRLLEKSGGKSGHWLAE